MIYAQWYLADRAESVISPRFTLTGLFEGYTLKEMVLLVLF